MAIPKPLPYQMMKNPIQEEICKGCGIPILVPKLNLDGPPTEASILFLELKNDFSQSVSSYSAVTCSCRQKFCYNCIWPHWVSFQHNSAPNALKYEVPQNTQAAEFHINLSRRISNNHKSLSTDMDKVLDRYKISSRNNYMEERTNAIKLIEYDIDIARRCENDVNRLSLLLAEKHFSLGSSEIASNIILKLENPSEESKINSWVLILNYLGPIWFKAKKNIVQEIEQTITNIKHRRDFPYDLVRLDVMVCFATRKITRLQEVQEMFFKAFPRISLPEQYYYYLDASRYNYQVKEDMLERLKLTEALTYFTYVYHQSTIFLSNAFKLLAKRYEKSKQYELSMNALELSVENFIKVAPVESPDILSRICDLAKLKIKFNSDGVENLLFLALKICDSSPNLLQKKLKVLVLLQSFYILTFNTESLTQVENCILHLKSIS